MKTWLIATMTGASLAIGFGCGWLVAQVHDVDKVTPAQVWTDNWISDVMLLTGGGHRTALMPPDKTQSIIRSGLNADSLVLGRVYDSLPENRKQQLMFYIPAARAIATAQQEPDPARNRSDLLTFASCMQKVKLQGGLVKDCVKDERK